MLSYILSRIFSCFPRKRQYKGAGVLFTNGIHVLAGFQPNKKTSCITGIGGSKEACETFLYTALREAVEELLNIKEVPSQIIYKLSDSLTPLSVFANKDYATLLYSFGQLETFLTILKENGIVTDLYEEFPLTLEELVFKRKNNKEAEIKQFAVLPLECSQISKDFLIDLQMALEIYKMGI
jgi:hypothetical protein